MEERKREKGKRAGIERADIRRSGLDNMHLDKCPGRGLRVSHSLLGAISQYPYPSLEQNAAQKWAFLAVCAFAKENADIWHLGQNEQPPVPQQLPCQGKPCLCACLIPVICSHQVITPINDGPK